MGGSLAGVIVWTFIGFVVLFFLVLAGILRWVLRINDIVERLDVIANAVTPRPPAAPSQ